MGGNAFNLILPHAVFPRMPSRFYFPLKDKLTSVLSQFYTKVTVPREAPEKTDYGDLDFVVCGPCEGCAHEDIKQALEASHSLPCDGLRGMHQFAIPFASIALKDWASSTDETSFFQVDVLVCGDEDEWDRVISYSSYGDLGMILGSIARGVGLSLGRNGLKLADPLPTSPPITFRLSTSFAQTLAFFGLSMEKWITGFTTQQEVFEWVTSSPFFDARKAPLMETSVQTAKSRSQSARPMFQNYLDYCRTLTSRTVTKPTTKVAVLEEALRYFDRRALYDLILHISSVKQYTKVAFTGTQVTEWTNLRGMPIRFVMDEVKRRLGGVELVAINIAVDDEIDPNHVTVAKWEEGMFCMSLDEIRTLTVMTKEAMEKEGKLVFDWREAKKRKAAKKEKATSASPVDSA